jgi:hypothetical protein
MDRRMLPPTVPTDPVPAYVAPLWCRVATRSEVRNIVDRALRHGRQRRLVIADRHIGTIADHMLA